MITLKRGPNLDYLIFLDGVVVGRAWRYQKGFNGTRRVGFGVSVNGVYWRQGEPSHSGTTGLTAKRLKDSAAIVQKAIDWLNVAQKEPIIGGVK